MRFLLLFFIPVLALATPECQRPCDTPGAPQVSGAGVLQDIREHVTGECVEVEEIIVRPPHADDPCSFSNLDSILYHDADGGDVSYSETVDKSYPASGGCAGVVANNFCFLRTNGIYAQSGSTRWRRDQDGDGYILDIKQSRDCREHKNNSCTIPYEREQLSIAVKHEDIFDAQNRTDSIVECRPENCYSITIGTNNGRTPGGYSLPLFQKVTVTREADGSIRSRLYVNGPVFTTRVTLNGLVGENRLRPELIGRRPDTFVSCQEDFNVRRASYFPRR